MITILINAVNHARVAGLGSIGEFPPERIYRLFYATVKALTFKTLSLLAAGEFRSGQDLAETLGVSRGAIWYALRGLSLIHI